MIYNLLLALAGLGVYALGCAVISVCTVAAWMKVTGR